MNRFQKQIDDIVARFVADVTQLAHTAATEMLAEGFATKGGGAPRRGPGRPPKAASAGGGGRGRGGRRSSGQLEGLSEKIIAHVAKHPGQRISEINKALGISTKDAALPIRKLVADGELKKKGNRRSTTYFPGKG